MKPCEIFSNLNWSTFKSIVDANKLSYKYVDIDDYYWIKAYDGKFEFGCAIFKDSGSDQTEFETNYKNKLQNPETVYNWAFSPKVLPDGSKLFRRVHGVGCTTVANGDVTVDFSVPYSKCKITEVEVIHACEGLTADFFVYYGATKLNQFGFGVHIGTGYYADESPYDADLTSALTLKATIHNSTSTEKLIGINFILHEVI
jgi:hypothetical protein